MTLKYDAGETNAQTSGEVTVYATSEALTHLRKGYRMVLLMAGGWGEGTKELGPPEPCGPGQREAEEGAAGWA